tara:strand:+ start:431 stop:613 length:183 start_codon:yes stop_codon:yes gene_type:complete
MPRSKHRKKGQTDRERRTKRNKRIAEQQYINSPKRWLEKVKKAQEAQEDNTDGVSEETSN